MNVYLVQHGNSVPKEKDPDRPLSYKGKEDVEKVADFLKKAGIAVKEVFHSGKTRARQTAEIMNAKLNPGSEPQKKKGISPLDEVKIIAEVIKKQQKDLMIVGHLPHLAKLTSFLTTMSDANSVAGFQQGGVVCLRSDEGKKTWTIVWMLVPEIIVD